MLLFWHKEKGSRRSLLYNDCELLHLDFDITTSWQAQVHEAVDGLWSRFEYVDKTLVDTHFELFTAFFIDVRAFDHRKCRFTGWQRNRASQRCTGAQRCVNNLLGSLVDYFVVIGLKADTNPLFAIGSFGVSHSN